jgi:phosphatidylethanolamine-binding protein (PEBP) family uncharacterized protein
VDGVASFALVCHDPYGPVIGSNGSCGHAYWVLYDIQASGACIHCAAEPPPGHGRQHYVFTLLALDVEPEFEDGLSSCELLARLEPHIVSTNRLTTRTLVGAMVVLSFAIRFVS